MTVASKKVITGFGWIALIAYTDRVLGFFTTLVLAKFLAPEDFGLIAIASMLIEVLYLFKDMGLSEALIYQKGNIEESSNCAFMIVFGLNILIFVLLVIASPFVADFYEHPSLIPVIILLSSNLIWNSMINVPYTIIRKNIDFKKLVAPNIIPIVVASVVSIIMAYNDCGVWSLVARSFSVSFLGMIIIWKYAKLRPSFRFNWILAKELLNYGKYIFGSSIFLVILYNIDKFYVSKFAGISALGFFELAMRIANMPVSEFSHLIGSVMFPVLSKMNDQRDAMRTAFIKTLSYSSMISIPMAVGIATYGPALIVNIYGAKWVRITTPLQILAFYAMMRSISSIISDLFKATGNPSLIQRFAMIKLVLVAILGIPSLILFELEGICYVILLAYIVVFVFESVCYHEY